MPRDGVPDMAKARTYFERLTWWFAGQEIGRGLRERYEVPEELPPKLLALVKRLDGLERNQSPRPRTLIGKLDAIEGKYLYRCASPVEPRSVGPIDDWPWCT